MIDGLFSGLLGGLFGPALAQWLSRFKYWAVFLAAMLLTQLLTVGVMLNSLGLEKTVAAFADDINPVFFYASAGIGAMTVIVAFIGSLSAPKGSDSTATEQIIGRVGDAQTMKSVVALSLSCSNCRDICERGAFSTRQEFTACASRVAHAAQNGTLISVPRPDWFRPDNKHFAPDGYYRCNSCDTVWTLVLPGREDNGLWGTIV